MSVGALQYFHLCISAQLEAAATIFGFVCSTPRLKKQAPHTLTGWYSCSRGMGMLCSEHSEQNILPQLLQWCFRRPIQNCVLHPVQASTAWSGTHSVGRASPSSTASQEVSDTPDSWPTEPPEPEPTLSGRDIWSSVPSWWWVWQRLCWIWL